MVLREPVWNDEGAGCRETVCGKGCLRAGAHGDRLVGKALVRGIKNLGIGGPADDSVGVVGPGINGPSMPVESSVFQVRDLGRQVGVNVQVVVGEQTQSQVAEQGNLVSTTVASQERKRRVGASVDGSIVDQLLRHLEERSSDIWFVRVLTVGVSRASRGRHLVGHDREDSPGHSRSIRRLLVGVLLHLLGL
jgi:hypothetical protein